MSTHRHTDDRNPDREYTDTLTTGTRTVSTHRHNDDRNLDREYTQTH